jgi:precorrin-6B C5,15-methyltransferase / cobalt-precorrin-6B C5,C15-methyltransferase
MRIFRMSRADPVMADTAPAQRWLSIVGIGEDGVDGLGSAAQRLVANAEIVFGGRRHLALAASLIRGEARPWASPFEHGISEVFSARGRAVCVLASGDPFMHGVGATLMRHVAPAECMVVPAPSAFSLAAARLGWSLPDCALVSLHARAPDLLRPHLAPAARVLALTSDANGPADVAGLLAAAGFGDSLLTVLERLGGPNERIRATPAKDFAFADVEALNLVAIEVIAGTDARVLPRLGLPDDCYEHDGQLTKREIRAITLSSLAPRRGELLWDIGAGAGSVAIEWMLADPSLRAIAIEARADRAARIARNAAACGVPGVVVVEGSAPAALAGLAAPNAIFIGGGAGRPGLLDAAMAALPPHGRLVVNAVTVETEALLLARHGALGGELIRIAVARAGPLGGRTGWRPALPVTQWCWCKP